MTEPVKRIVEGGSTGGLGGLQYFSGQLVTPINIIIIASRRVLDQVASATTSTLSSDTPRTWDTSLTISVRSGLWILGTEGLRG